MRRQWHQNCIKTELFTQIQPCIRDKYLNLNRNVCLLTLWRPKTVFPGLFPRSLSQDPNANRPNKKQSLWPAPRYIVNPLRICSDLIRNCQWNGSMFLINVDLWWHWFGNWLVMIDPLELINKSMDFQLNLINQLVINCFSQLFLSGPSHSPSVKIPHRGGYHGGRTGVEEKRL